MHNPDPVTRPPRARMLPSDIKDAFIARGWVRGAGGDLYFNGMRSSTHPHLHLKTASVHDHRPPVGGDIRMAVHMLAHSTGHPGRGKTFIWNKGDSAHPLLSEADQAFMSSAAVRKEYTWILSYFTLG